jgi:hypothetical protein
MSDTPQEARIKSGRLNDTSNPNSLSSKFRQKRDIRLRDLISRTANKQGALQILDLGGSVEYWRRVGLDFLREHNARVVVLNSIASELKAVDADEALFTTIVGDACDLSEIKDRQFDLVHSNSVIEHVGDWSRMKRFASEARRVGTNYYVQTPYYWFPVDPHYYRAPLIHWLPRPLQARLLTRFDICTAGRAATLDDAFSVLDGTSLLDRWQFRMLFPEAEILPETVMGLTKSLIAIHCS